MELDPFSAILEADPVHLRGLRKTIATWLVDVDIDDEVRDAVVLATHEAAASAVAASPATVSVDGSIDGHSVVVVVASDGEWKSPESDEAGHRMRVLRSVMTSVQFEPGSGRGSLRLEKDF